ncbi:hypothetical protein [Propionivibrio dicarboxylicus]|uniref:Rhamnosyl transferase n=1 Tax=Propionivibrio dicarboxylicus TaxID=83767 RepID=A0A1G8DW42_9RHOO|nr:hypothetical protein [Propionivibrio dicarboxylicus]SDH61649.1 hypothetical protein SAMN05660652_01957 [Propionivibrio dicarboxylicus]
MALYISKEKFQVSLKGRALLRKHELINEIKSNRFLKWCWGGVKRSINMVNRRGADVTSSNVNGDLVVIFRHVHISKDKARFPNKSRPEGFSHLKCLINLIDTISESRNRNRVKVFIFYNGTQEQLLEDGISKFLENCSVDVTVKIVDATSAVESVLAMFDAINSVVSNDDDIVYVLENDYLHAHGWVDEVFELSNSKIKFDYISLYDHPDRYKMPNNYKKSTIFVTNTRHWVSAPSTCGTFLFKKSVFNRDFKYLYSTKNDHQMFKRLTVKLKRVLLTPIPGLAVHCMSEHLDPVCRLEKWLTEFENE